MKKILCLVLSLTMIFSCFGLGMTASAADYRYRPDGSANPDGTLKPDLVGKIIDPVLYGKDTVFADGIKDIAYESVQKYTGSVTEENFNSFIATNSNDAMFGVKMGYLYDNSESNFFWSLMKYDLEVAGSDIHNDEVKAAVQNKKKSTCSAKGAYDACKEVLYGYEYEYTLKNTDVKIFESIVEVPFTIYNSATGRDEVHYKYYYQFDKGNFALVKANANNQIYNTITKQYSDGAIFNGAALANENAIKLGNFIGNLLYHDFKEIPANSKVFTDNKIKTEDFFRKVAEISGLGYILDEYWCNNKSFDVKKILSAFGVIVSEGAIFNIELEDGIYMGGRLLTDIYREFLKNPVDYTMTVLQKFCRNYTASYLEPIKLLFLEKFDYVVTMSNNPSQAAAYPLIEKYTGHELETVDGLIGFITDCIYMNNIDNPKTEASASSVKKFEFAPLPVAKISTASDITELYLYMLCYFNINSIYENNAEKIDAFIDTLSAGNDETRITLEAMFKTGYSMTEIHSFYLGTLTGNTIENFSDNFMSTVRKAFAGFIQNIIEAMDNFMNLLFGWTGGLFN